MTGRYLTSQGQGWRFQYRRPARYLRRSFAALSKLVDVVRARQPEAPNTAGVLLGEEALKLGRGEERVAAAHVHPAAGQGRAGEHRPDCDFLEHLAGRRVQGDELAAAHGGEV